MDKIELQDIYLTSMKLCSMQGTKSCIYIEKDKCYKILTGLYDREKVQLLDKLYEMDGIGIDGIIFPKELIFEDSGLMGYTMNYFPDSLCLDDYFNKGVI